jgi:hypothetical protein
VLAGEAPFDETTYNDEAHDAAEPPAGGDEDPSRPAVAR